MNTNRRKPGQSDRGFTLVELLVVVLIVVIVSAATLPTVLPALNHRQVGEGARLLHATISGARDAAIRANAPRGVRLMPDPAFPGPGTLAANRMIAIEPAPDYSSGRISVTAIDIVNQGLGRLSITEAVSDANGFPNEPTSWYWNIRQGDKIRFDDSGRYYTVAGPLHLGAYNMASGVPVPYNVERYVNFGPPGYVMNLAIPPQPVSNNPDPTNVNHLPERLFLVNGQDDNGNGWIDEGFDGIDNDGDGVTDPGYNGLDDNGDGQVDEPAELLFSMPGFPPGGEFEQESFQGSQLTSTISGLKYTIFRRPVVSEGAREVALPQGVVIDLTTWNAISTTTQNGTPAPTLPERSRLPVDPYSFTVDVMIAPNGQVIPAGAGSASINSGITSASPTSNMPFYHFWIAEREDVLDPIWRVNNNRTVAVGKSGSVTTQYGVPFANVNFNPANNTGPRYLLPMPENTTNFVTPGNGPYLKGERRLVTLFVRTGQVVTNDIQNFDVTDTSTPYYPAQFGTRDVQ